jgi:hypothetical protein
LVQDFTKDPAVLEKSTPEIAQIPNQYVRGYTSTDPNPNAKFRTIRVEVNVPRLPYGLEKNVRSRTISHQNSD